MLDNLLSLIGAGVGVLGVFAGYLYHIHSRKPDAAAIATELRQSLGVNSDNQSLRMNHHVVKIADAKVTSNGEWLNDREDAAKQRRHVLLRGIFVGGAEVNEYFEIPGSPPPIEKIRTHPYYGKAVEFEDAHAGTDGFHINTSEKTLSLQVNFYADTARKGAASIITARIIAGQIIDDVLSGRIDKKKDIPPFDEFMSKGLDREDIESSITTWDELHQTDFVLPRQSDQSSTYRHS